MPHFARPPQAAPAASPVALPPPMSPCRLPRHFATPPMSVPLLVSHVSLSCFHELRYLFCQVELFSCRHFELFSCRHSNAELIQNAEFTEFGSG